MKISFVIFLFGASMQIYSCKGQVNKENGCYSNFSKAKKIAYSSNTRISALDSALNLTNLMLNCDTVRRDAIELKATILTQLERFEEGIRFVDSLKASDFNYGFKKEYLSKLYKAFSLERKGELESSKNIYKEIDTYFSNYIKNNLLSVTEFKQVLIYQFEIKGRYITKNEINKQVDSLKLIYPDKSEFLNFLIQD